MLIQALSVCALEGGIEYLGQGGSLSLCCAIELVVRRCWILCSPWRWDSCGIRGRVNWERKLVFRRLGSENTWLTFTRVIVLYNCNGLATFLRSFVLFLSLFFFLNNNAVPCMPLNLKEVTADHD